MLSAVQGLSGKARTDKLIELADAEGGELNVYTSSSIDYMTELSDDFSDATDVDASLYKTSSEALVERMVEEQKAGFHGSDVAETNTPGLIALDDEGLLVPYSSPNVDKLVPGSVGKSWIGDKSNTFVVAWNTKRVPKGEEPKSIAELADPKWKGRLVMEADDSDWYKTIWESVVDSGKTPAEADKIFEGIAKNAAFVNGHSLMADLVAAGEFDVSLDSYLHTVKGLMEKGAPIAWEPAVEPLVTRPDGIAVVKDAKHPAAALLYVDYVLDPGQKNVRRLLPHPRPQGPQRAAVDRPRRDGRSRLRRTRGRVDEDGTSSSYASARSARTAASGRPSTLTWMGRIFDADVA